MLALFALGWLNLIVQPCQAAMPMMPAGMEDCGHGGTPDQAPPCPTMQAGDCEASFALNADAPPSPALTRPAAFMLPVPEASSGGIVNARLHPAATGPPLTIRFCTLRN